MEASWFERALLCECGSPVASDRLVAYGLLPTITTLAIYSLSHSRRYSVLAGAVAGIGVLAYRKKKFAQIPLPLPPEPDLGFVMERLEPLLRRIDWLAKGKYEADAKLTDSPAKLRRELGQLEHSDPQAKELYRQCDTLLRRL